MKQKVIFCAIVLLCVAGYAFYRGCVFLKVPVGACAVLSSKTSGTYPQPITHSAFLWRWEALIPKNITLTSYSLAPRTISSNIQGSLPSAELYAMQVKGNPDFSYSFKIDVVLSPKAEQIRAVAKGAEPLSPNQFEALLTEAAQRVASDTADFIIRSCNEQPARVAPEYTSEEILVAISAQEKYAAFDISSVFVKEAHIPDTELYALAKNTYRAYQETLSTALEREAEIQAKALVEDNRTLNKLEKFGEVLEKYPKNYHILIILEYIDHLQQEQPEVDLEKVIDGLTAGWIEGEEYGELQNINTHQCVALKEVKEVMCCMFELGLKAGKEE